MYKKKLPLSQWSNPAAIEPTRGTLSVRTLVARWWIGSRGGGRGEEALHLGGVRGPLLQPELRRAGAVARDGGPRGVWGCGTELGGGVGVSLAGMWIRRLIQQNANHPHTLPPLSQASLFVACDSPKHPPRCLRTGGSIMVMPFLKASYIAVVFQRSFLVRIFSFFEYFRFTAKQRLGCGRDTLGDS